MFILFNKTPTFLAMRMIGCDWVELSLFCGVMDLPQPVQKSSYNIINNPIEKAACSVQQQSMTDAAAAEFSVDSDQGHRASKHRCVIRCITLSVCVCVCVLFKKQCFFLFLFLIIIIPCCTVTYASEHSSVI